MRIFFISLLSLSLRILASVCQKVVSPFIRVAAAVAVAMAFTEFFREFSYFHFLLIFIAALKLNVKVQVKMWQCSFHSSFSQHQVNPLPFRRLKKKSHLKLSKSL